MVDPFDIFCVNINKRAISWTLVTTVSGAFDIRFGSELAYVKKYEITSRNVFRMLLDCGGCVYTRDRQKTRKGNISGRKEVLLS